MPNRNTTFKHKTDYKHLHGWIYRQKTSKLAMLCDLYILWKILWLMGNPVMTDLNITFKHIIDYKHLQGLYLRESI